MEQKAFEMAMAFQRGEEAGFDYFFNRLWSELLFYCRRFIYDQDVAKDIVEESFIRLWKKHETIDNPYAIKSWLYATVKNGAINAINKEKFKRAVIKNVSLTQENDVAADALLVRKEIVKQVQSAIGALPKRCQEIIRLRFIEGVPVAEIEVRLKVTKSTVKNQIVRGMALMRNSMDEKLHFLNKSGRYVRRINYSKTSCWKNTPLLESDQGDISPLAKQILTLKATKSFRQIAEHLNIAYGRVCKIYYTTRRDLFLKS